MASKGTLAKENLINKLIAAAGSDYVGCVDKKYYFWADDGGERIQVAVSMTCPKNAISANNSASTSVAVDDFAIPTATPQVEISNEERKTIEDLMAKLGL